MEKLINDEFWLTNLPIAFQENDIIYVESEYNEEVNKFFQMYYEKICNHFNSRGYRFIYFPRLSDDILEEIICNHFPNQEQLSPDIISLKSTFMIQFFPKEEQKYYYCPSFICYITPNFDISKEPHTKESDYWAHLYTVADPNIIYETDNLSVLLDSIEEELDLENKIELMDDFDPLIPSYDYDDIVYEDKNIIESENAIFEVFKKERSKKVKGLIKDINEKINELNQCDKDYTIYSYFLRREIRPFTVISDIVVKQDCSIVLPANNICMGFSAQMKALYLLYLNHQEGINYLNVKKCRDELLQWYRWCDPKDPKADIIDKLFEVKKNERHPIVSLISRIKSELKENLGEFLCDKYCIRNEGEGFYRINTSDYNVKFEKKYHFREDMSPNYLPGTKDL